MHIRLRINNETNTYGISKSNTMKKLHVEMAMQSSLIITNHSFKEEKKKTIIIQSPFMTTTKKLITRFIGIVSGA